MEIRQTVESIRDIAVDAWMAGKVVVASLLERADERLSDALNRPEDNDET